MLIVNNEKILFIVFFRSQHDYLKNVCYSNDSSMVQLVKTSACNLKLLSLNTVGGF